MDFPPLYILAGVGACLSLFAFFIKRVKAEVDMLHDQINQLRLQIKDDEILTNQLEVRVGVHDKLLEDRRQDIIKIFESRK